jgi:hypothetical protein
MAKQRLIAELGLNIQSFLDSIAGAEGGLGKLGKSVKSAAAVIGVLGGGLSILNDYLKNTVIGQNAVNIAMSVGRQVITDLTKGQLLNIGSLYETARAQSALNAILTKNRFEGIQVADMTQRLEILRYNATDATRSETEKLNALNEALRIHFERKKFLIENAAEELKATKRLWDRDQDNIELQNKMIALMTELKGLQGADLEARRLNAQITGIQAEEQKKLADNLERITKLGPAYLEAIDKDIATANEKAAQSLIDLKKANELANPNGYIGKGFGKINGLLTPAGIDTTTLKPNINEKSVIADVTGELTKQQLTVMGLANTFAGFFSGINLGFQDMIDGFVTGIKRLAMELLAKAAILSILMVITGGSARGVGKLLLNSVLPGIGDLTGNGGGGGGMAMGNIMPMSNGTGTEILRTEVTGKSLAIILERYYNDMG